MNSKIKWLFLFYTTYISVYSQSYVGPTSFGLGGASVTYTNDVWSARNNPANLAFIKHKELAMSIENRFFIKELSYNHITVVMPLYKGSIGITNSLYGYTLFNQNHLSVAYGLKLLDHVSFGVSLNYLTLNMADIYGRAHSITGSIGLTTTYFDNMIIAISTFNPWRSTYFNNPSSEKTPNYYKIGVQYFYSPHLKLIGEVENTNTQLINFRSGVAFSMLSNLTFRIGMATHPIIGTFGFSYQYKKLSIDFTVAYHVVLKASSQFGVTYAF